MEEILACTANYGFPMVITAYLLVRIEAKLDKLTESINALSKVIGRN